MKLLCLAALILTLEVATLGAQMRVAVGNVGQGPSGRILRQVLATPHRLVEPDTGWFTMQRGEQEGASLVVLGRSAAIAGIVEGDVVVVGGDLFVRPGARIGGRAIAIGGGVYPSTLATIAGGSQSFRDNTFTVTRTPEEYRLDYVSLRAYAAPALQLPGLYGLRFPTYDRVNGASVPFGPAFSFGGGRGEANLVATYRSDLGKIDPSIDVNMQPTDRWRAHLRAERGTFTNDAWIWGIVNSLSSLVFGADTRNYYRGDRAELTIHRSWDETTTQLEPFVGAQIERAWSVGPVFGERRGPWSFRGREDSLGMWRPNPVVVDGTITSALFGSSLGWRSQELSVRVRVRGEVGLTAPLDAEFTQLTSDVNATFPTFGEQEYALDVHWVTTPGGTPPPQRFAYLGGHGTLPFHDLLEFGGDELLFIDQRYSYPLKGVSVGFLGSPTLLLRHRLGSAGLARLPRFEQVVGLAVELTFVRVELMVEPSSGRTRLTAGLSFSR